MTYLANDQVFKSYPMKAKQSTNVFTSRWLVKSYFDSSGGSVGDILQTSVPNHPNLLNHPYHLKHPNHPNRLKHPNHPNQT